MAEQSLKKQYANRLARFHYFENCLKIYKQDVKRHGDPDDIETMGETEAMEKALDLYNSYKFVIKCEAKDLKELKYKIRENDRKFSKDHNK